MDEYSTGGGFCIRTAARGGSGGGTEAKCGRWNPTSEQIKVLTELFGSGLRTPSTDQIRKISSELSFYGKIESKNVFYWFQNHKARERHKRRRVLLDDQHFHQNFSSTKNFVEMNVNKGAAQEQERAVETLPLFPIKSFTESDSEKLRLFADDCKENNSSFSYMDNQEMDNPTLDLRLSFV